MKRFVGLTLAFLLLFNLFGCQWLNPNDDVPDEGEIFTDENPTEEISTSDKEKLIKQLNRDFPIDKEVSFLLANPFSQSVFLKQIYSFGVKIEGSDIYLNDAIYDVVNIVSNPEISYDKEKLIGVNVHYYYDEILESLSKIEKSETYFILETKEETTIGTRIALYEIEGDYYFINFDETGDVFSVHILEIEYNEPDISLNEMIDTVKQDTAENAKITFSTRDEDLYYELKDSGLYDDSEWYESTFIIYVICNYDNATNEDWYKECGETDRKSLNHAFFNYCKSNLKSGSYTNSILTDGLFSVYSTAGGLYLDYSAIKALAELDYVTSIDIEYKYGLPCDYIFGN